MAKVYTTPDFDVTAYEVEDLIAGPAVGDGDPDGYDPSLVYGDLV